VIIQGPPAGWRECYVKLDSGDSASGVGTHRRGSGEFCSIGRGIDRAKHIVAGAKVGGERKGAK